MAQRLDFIDISRYQGTINFVLVKEDGVLGVIAKCSEGTGYIDPNYKNNRAGALNAGLAFASYHYLSAGNGAKQMDWYLGQADLRYGERIVIDYEETSPRVSMKDLKDAVLQVRALRPDLQITIYGASMLTDDCLACQDTSFLYETSLWAARYSSNYPVIATPPWEVWSAWQYSDEGKVDGISGPVDVNMFNSSNRNDCLAWFGPTAEPIPTPTPEPRPAEAVVSTTKAYGDEVTVMIDPNDGVTVWINGVEMFE